MQFYHKVVKKSFTYGLEDEIDQNEILKSKRTIFGESCFIEITYSVELNCFFEYF